MWPVWWRLLQRGQNKVIKSIHAFLGVTEAAVAAGALVPEEAPEEGECQFLASPQLLVSISVINRSLEWTNLTCLCEIQLWVRSILCMLSW